MTDVLLRQFNDGGNIDYENGQVITSDGLETAAYLSLWGGNERDSGQQADDPLEWWGNKSELLEERKHRSALQNLMRAIPLVPANLQRFEDAAGTDLEWFVETKLANFVGVIASLPALNTVQIDIEIRILDEIFRFVFTERARLQS